ncbi:hypothetical protein C4572_00085, partial [Candidatus Parcubacteria bacterium]
LRKLGFYPLKYEGLSQWQSLLKMVLRTEFLSAPTRSRPEQSGMVERFSGDRSIQFLSPLG